MPKLWDDTIEAHRRTVRDAILDTAASLAAEHGLRAVTMSQVATHTGIGRATLYKYFADVEAILLAWHERQIAAHLTRLVEARDAADDPLDRLVAVLGAYAAVAHESGAHHDSELAAFLHRDHQVMAAQHRVHHLLGDLVADAARAGAIRTDVAPAELATYCLHALGGAAGLSSRAAVRRLVDVTIAGLQPA